MDIFCAYQFVSSESSSACFSQLAKRLLMWLSHVGQHHLLLNSALYNTGWKATGGYDIFN